MADSRARAEKIQHGHGPTNGTRKYGSVHIDNTHTRIQILQSLNEIKEENI